MIIRNYQETDLIRLHEINAASTPGVSEETLSDLSKIIALSTCLVAVSDRDEPLGFITLIAPGTLAYESLNLRWFEDWCEANPQKLIYVDRIALAPEARGQRLGDQLYAAAFDAFHDWDSIGCEVNTSPDNPLSHRFHARMGFERVGHQQFTPEKAVAYYVRNL